MPEQSSEQGAAHEERFVISQAGEVLRLLTQLKRSQSLIQMVWGEGQHQLTTIIEVLRDQHLIALDQSQSPEVNDKLLTVRRIACDGNFDGIAFRFVLGRLRKAELLGSRVFATAPPTWLYWRQQREYFRVKTPRQRPIVLHIPPTPDFPNPTRYPVLDLSLGGLAFVSQGNEPVADINSRLPNVSFELPGFGQVISSIEIRNVLVVGSRRHDPHKSNAIDANSPKKRFRYGCRFIDLSHSSERVLHHYINERQRELNTVRE